jgi:DNA-binding MarR family transcriptional regulator
MNKTSLKSAAETATSDQAIFSLLAAAHALEDRIEAALGTVGLSMPKFSVLSALVSSGNPMSLSELASELSCVRSNMTQLVDRLEADGLVRRVTCPGDRRLVKAEITDLGRDKQRAGQAEFDSLNASFATTIGPAERRALQRMATALK